MTDRGYTVFAVVHGSQPRYTIPEIVQDMNRAVRFIRYHANDYAIDPDRFGVTGASAGGYLSLMLGLPARTVTRKPKIPWIAFRAAFRLSPASSHRLTSSTMASRARRKFVPIDHAPPYRPAFDYRELDKQSNLWVSDHRSQAARGDRSRQFRQSPMLARTTHQRSSSMVDADRLVPLQQSELIVEELKKAGVQTNLVVKKGAGHGWIGMDKDDESTHRLVRQVPQESS